VYLFAFAVALGGMQLANHQLAQLCTLQLVFSMKKVCKRKMEGSLQDKSHFFCFFSHIKTKYNLVSIIVIMNDL